MNSHTPLTFATLLVFLSKQSRVAPRVAQLPGFSQNTHAEDTSGYIVHSGYINYKGAEELLLKHEDDELVLTIVSVENLHIQ